MSTIQQIYGRLCRFAVFGGILKKPLLTHFMSYCRAGGDIATRRMAYGAFVAEIYAGGADLTDCVRRLVFEDENVYVKTIGNMARPSPHIALCAANELTTLSSFAALTTADFAADMGDLDYLPAFSSSPVDLRAEYEERTAAIGRHGYGIFAANGMFSVGEDGSILPIASADRISLDRFIGYREERQRVIDNTVMFLEGRPAANILLYGDAGTGKSSTVKAVANAYFDQGLRLIEIRKNQLLQLPRVMGEIADNPLKFIIFIDDLSFNQNDDTFSMLKATLEGSASARAKNAVIYATSNRRHIVKETFDDRAGNDIHRNDTVQENLSLSERFGLTVLFAKPEKKLYLEIIHELAERHGITRDPAELEREAESFALKRGYRSARCAEQFIESLL
ncbi:MAG: ATP-binding protein [Clostridia bacterium]|nr:ATP-binding protein [Clostridia bacterium]